MRQQHEITTSGPLLGSDARPASNQSTKTSGATFGSRTNETRKIV